VLARFTNDTFVRCSNVMLLADIRNKLHSAQSLDISKISTCKINLSNITYSKIHNVIVSKCLIFIPQPFSEPYSLFL
jgi:hypothetical protein